MKAALSRILEIFVSHDRREKRGPVHRSYCICGALKPEVEGPKRESLLKTEGVRGVFSERDLETGPGPTKPKGNYKCATTAARP